MNVRFYCNFLNSNIKKNIENFLFLNKNVNKIIFDNWFNVDSNYLTNLVFPNLNSSNTDTKEKNIWINLSLRPFKICPINKEKLYLVSNNSILNICIFNQLDKLIGFIVISDKKEYYWIEIFCTNIGQGIGSLIDNLIKLILISKPIRLISTFNSKEFYIKKKYKILNNYLLEYKKN
jgi:hypothetical protein